MGSCNFLFIFLLYMLQVARGWGRELVLGIVMASPALVFSGAFLGGATMREAVLASDEVAELWCGSA